MHIASGIDLVSAFTFRGKHVTITRFVTERPENNRRMVFVALHHGIHTVYSRSAPVVTILREVIVCTVTFDVRFVNHVNTVLVAEIVHHRIVRIVRHTERVDVEALHEDNVFFHTIVSHSTAVIRIKFVTVHTMELHRHTVYIQTRSAIVFLDFNFSKTNLVTFDLKNLAVRILERKHCGIEVRCFGRPAFRRRVRNFEMDTLFGTIRTNAGNLLGSRLNHFGTGSIVQRKFHGVITRLLARRIVNPSGRL